jgi:hypothetical protein
VPRSGPTRTLLRGQVTSRQQRKATAGNPSLASARLGLLADDVVVQVRDAIALGDCGIAEFDGRSGERAEHPDSVAEQHRHELDFQS